MIETALGQQRQRVAQIGVGGRGSFLLGQVLEIPGVDMVAICDLDRAKREAALDTSLRNALLQTDK